jgi:hypothetical protein
MIQVPYGPPPRIRPTTTSTSSPRGASGRASAAAAIAFAVTGEEEEPARRYQVSFENVSGPQTASARANLESDDEGTEIHLWVRGLPAENAVYEVLCDAEEWTATAGTFRTDARGRGYVVLTTALRGDVACVVTVRTLHHYDEIGLLDESELALWEEVAEGLVDNFDPETNLFEQHRGYFDLEYIDLQDLEPRTKSVDAILGWSRLTQSQIIKQADVIMLLFLLGDEYPREVHVVPSLPLTPVGKVDRKKLRERLREEATA